ncbi:hypothetical protein [Lactobacillus intestinalis]|uniref:Bacteriocin-type signal sequence n=1 Tax=Lactobacillus intestinalis DSM 6629 TaxID=1423761 RepID=A0ABR5PT97_9LACO|nr:hypothetical protein [Lactobacillus intestinalis]KRM34301.1 hypothetical protein FC44_GL001388 [Lactobacillus intestinalis DSM 6629]UTW40700.1 hypothetical protein KBW87_02050 [Lactobacillus intestinalis]
MKDTVKFEKLDCNQLSKIVGGKRKKHHPWYWSIQEFGRGFLAGLASKYNL